MTHTPDTVGDAMIRTPKLCDPATTAAQARDLLGDEHVHALLVVRDGTLLAVVERADLTDAPADRPARACGRLAGRVVGPEADLQRTWRHMRLRDRRRLAVLDDAGRLLGLLCLKRSWRGFCSEAGIAARQAAAGRGGAQPGQQASGMASVAPSVP